MLQSFNAEKVLASVLFTTCDGPRLKNLIRAGLAWLEQHYEAVNRLNVFPVPDGDTGTNMLLTMRAAYQAIADEHSPAASEIAEKLANGALHGSRGNSGTVLSQFFRGFANAARGSHVLDAAKMAASFREAARAGYQTFQKPVEGTILTVAREIADEVENAARTARDLRRILKRAVIRGKRAVARTPELLPILKKAGVVDSGGQGLVVILEGMLRYLYGQTLTAIQGKSDAVPIDAAALREAYALLDEYGEAGFGFDVQYTIRGEALDIDRIRRDVQAMGHSPIVIGDSSLVRVHLHVPDPDVPLRYGRQWGALDDIVIENMQEQTSQYAALRTGGIETRPAAIAVIAVAPGEGLRDLFYDQLATVVVPGGQTMNPSTGELLEAIRRANADKIVLLPNNANILLTAQQAARIAAERTGQQVVVIPTRTVPQGIAAMLGYVADGDFETVIANMKAAADQVATGEVTTATRSLDLDGLHVQAGQLIGLVDGQLAVSGADRFSVVNDLLGAMAITEREVVTIYYGDLVESAEAEALAVRLRALYPDQVFEVLRGGQPHYPYILGVE